MAGGHQGQLKGRMASQIVHNLKDPGIARLCQMNAEDKATQAPHLYCGRYL